MMDKMPHRPWLDRGRDWLAGLPDDEAVWLIAGQAVPSWSASWPTINRLSRARRIRVVAIDRHRARIEVIGAPEGPPGNPS